MARTLEVTYTTMLKIRVHKIVQEYDIIDHSANSFMVRDRGNMIRLSVRDAGSTDPVPLRDVQLTLQRCNMLNT